MLVAYRAVDSRIPATRRHCNVGCSLAPSPASWRLRKARNLHAILSSEACKSHLATPRDFPQGTRSIVTPNDKGPFPPLLSLVPVRPPEGSHRLLDSSARPCIRCFSAGDSGTRGLAASGLSHGPQFACRLSEGRPAALLRYRRQAQVQVQQPVQRLCQPLARPPMQSVLCPPDLTLSARMDGHAMLANRSTQLRATAN